MSSFVWKQDTDKKKAVRLVAVNEDFWLWKERVASHKEAMAWCSNNSIFCWGDSLSTIKFTSEKDMFTFLLRWS